jgi:hypothetical protein
MDGSVGDFFRTMGAVLAANLLTVLFIYALTQYGKLERAGQERQPGAGQHIGTVLLVLGFLFAGLYAAGFFDGALARFTE